ncbi:MAG TPA: cyanophycin synthetase [Solirubrobacteraceae bacterium]|nr:cyanophycin synthetase [Solirubrobacteraceae bacterium]
MAASRSTNAPWTPEHAESHLRSLELFGMRFGLDRMRRMMTVLGSPQQRFQTIHVVGTNGKTSTTRMIAAILQGHSLSVGSYTSPHLISYSERVQVKGEDVTTHAFATAIARAAHAAEQVNRTLVEGDHVTQFELMTAAAFWELARREVDVVVVEAGLGGRFDATNVIDSSIAVLTNVGLEHTRWLGPTVRDIATEKLAVLGEDSVLVVPSALPQEVLSLAREAASERGAELILAEPPLPEQALAAAGRFQQENFALARCAAEVYLTQTGVQPRESEVIAAAARVCIPGRLQTIDTDPLTVLDGAHNPAAAEALADALADLLSGREVALVMGVLEDKDAAAMLARLLPHFQRAWFTAPPSARALSPSALASLARQLGFEQAVCEPNPERALRGAREWAAARADGAAVVATGSVYLVGDLLARASEAGMDRESGYEKMGMP